MSHEQAGWWQGWCWAAGAGRLVLGTARAAAGTARSPHVVAGEVLSLLQQWYTSSMNVVCTWLTDRMDLQLHIYQLKTLIRIVKVIVPCVFNSILLSEGTCVYVCMCAACSLRQPVVSK